MAISSEGKSTYNFSRVDGLEYIFDIILKTRVYLVKINGGSVYIGTDGKVVLTVSYMALCMDV